MHRDLTRLVTRTRRGLIRSLAFEHVQTTVTNPLALKRHRPLPDTEGKPIEGKWQTMKALTEDMRSECGDETGWAAKVYVLATEASKEAIVGGTAGPKLVVTTDMVTETFQQSAKRRGSAPGPGAITYEVLGLLGEQTVARTFGRLRAKIGRNLAGFAQNRWLGTDRARLKPKRAPCHLKYPWERVYAVQERA